MPDDEDIDPRRPDNADEIGGQDRLTVEADTVVPPAVLVRRGWAASTFESFRYRDFTLFWSGALVSNVGTWMQNAAIAIVVFAIDPPHASLNTGIVQGLSGLPVLFLAIPAGAVADRVDRRRLLVWIQVVLLAQAAALGVLYDLHVIGPAQPLTALGIVAGLGLIGGIFVAFQGPAFQSMLPDLVERRVAHERHRAQLRAAPDLPDARPRDRRRHGARRKRHGARLLHQRGELPVRDRGAAGHTPARRVPRRSRRRPGVRRRGGAERRGRR